MSIIEIKTETSLTKKRKTTKRTIVFKCDHCGKIYKRNYIENHIQKTYHFCSKSCIDQSKYKSEISSQIMQKWWSAVTEEQWKELSQKIKEKTPKLSPEQIRKNMANAKITRSKWSDEKRAEMREWHSQHGKDVWLNMSDETRERQLQQRNAGFQKFCQKRRAELDKRDAILAAQKKQKDAAELAERLIRLQKKREDQAARENTDGIYRGPQNINNQEFATTDFTILLHRQLYQQWKLPILQRDNFSCQNMLEDNKKCNTKSTIWIEYGNKHQTFDQIKDLIIKQNGYTEQDLHDFETRQEIANLIVDYHIKNNISGITVCEECHRKLHSKQSQLLSQQTSTINQEMQLILDEDPLIFYNLLSAEILEWRQQNQPSL